MKEPIRVLMIVPNLRVSNGVASYAMNYFRRLDRQAVHMDFALIADIPTPYYQELREAGCSCYALPGVRSPLRHLRACRKIIREGHYDIIHDNVPLKSLPLMMCAKHHVPVRILHSHSSKLGETPRKEKRNRLFLPLLIRTATDYAACSQKAAQALFGDAPYEFIPNIISGERLSYSAEKRGEIRAAMNVEDKIVIGSVGRVAAAKNPLFALDVIAELVKREPEIEYWWIGSGPMDQELKKGVAERRLQNHVKILGSREDVPDLYQAMDVFFLPSLFEGLPVTGLEAQAMGLPAVVSDTVTDEMVYTDLVKFVSLEAPLSAWAEALEEQISRRHERRSCSAELRQSVFSEDAAGERLADVYRRLYPA